MNIKKTLSNIREYFWPLLEKEVNDKAAKRKDIELKNIEIKNQNLKIAYDLALRYYEKEEERREVVETKSTIFIGSLGVAIAIIIAIAKDISKLGKSNNVSVILAVLAFIIVIYLCRALWFSIKVLERKGYEIIKFKDFNNNEQESKYIKNLIVLIINKTRKNSPLIDTKVSYMATAQAYFLNAVKAIYAFSVFIISVIIMTHFAGIKTFFLELNISNWKMIILIGLIILSFVTNLIITNIKIKKAKKEIEETKIRNADD